MGGVWLKFLKKREESRDFWIHYTALYVQGSSDESFVLRDRTCGEKFGNVTAASDIKRKKAQGIKYEIAILQGYLNQASVRSVNFSHHELSLDLTLNHMDVMSSR